MKPKQAIDALRRDLIHKDGPQISTMRNYRFAIVQYAPEEEFALRGEVQRLSVELASAGWVVVTIDLSKLLFDRLRALGDEVLSELEALERQLNDDHPDAGLEYLKDHLGRLIEGPEGVAADCARIIREHADRHPDKADRMVAFIGRAGALYPFFRSSALLRDLDGKTKHVPVVLLYPGTRLGPTGLSFMGVLNPDSDYRPRIYP